MSHSVAKLYLQQAANFQASCQTGIRGISSTKLRVLFNTYQDLERTYHTVIRQLRNRTELARVQTEHTKVVRAAQRIFPERLRPVRGAQARPVPAHLPIDSAQTTIVRELRTALCRRASLEECFNHFRKLDQKVQFRCYELLFRERIINDGIDQFLRNPQCVLPLLDQFGSNGRALKDLLEADDFDLQDAFNAFMRLHPDQQMRCYELLCRNIIIREGIDKFLENPSALLLQVKANGYTFPIIDHLIIASRQSNHPVAAARTRVTHPISRNAQIPFTGARAATSERRAPSLPARSQTAASPATPARSQEVHVEEEYFYDDENTLFESAQELLISLRDDTVGRISELYRKGRLDKRRISPETFTGVLERLREYQRQTQKPDYLRTYETFFRDIDLIFRTFIERTTRLCAEEDLSDAQKKKDLVEMMRAFPALQALAEQIETRTFLPRAASVATSSPTSSAPMTPSLSKYDQQIILNLGRGTSARGMSEKGATKGLTSQMIDLKNVSERDFTALRTLTPQSRLYIIGHCNAGYDYIYSDQGVRMTYEEYADILAREAPQLKNKTTPIRISVYACYGGEHSSTSRSFCEKLSKALDERGIYAEVLGRTGPVRRWDGHGVFRKRIGDPFTKLCFVTRSGETRTTNAYSE